MVLGVSSTQAFPGPIDPCPPPPERSLRAQVFSLSALGRAIAARDKRMEARMELSNLSMIYAAQLADTASAAARSMAHALAESHHQSLRRPAVCT